MNRSLVWNLAFLATALTAAPGCFVFPPDHSFSGDFEHYDAVATEIEYPDVETHAATEVYSAPTPVTIASDAPPTYWDISLEEAVQSALVHTKVLRDLGGSVVRSPDSLGTIHDAAITETDPRFGVDAALSAFDANLLASAFFEKNDRAINNEILGGGVRLFQQDLHNYQVEVNKRAATGGLFALRKRIQYDANNATGNLFPSAWDVQLEGEFRQPLLQGSGVKFNRIAGPDGIPGVPRGVLIARINTDIKLADFETGVRELVSNVENAYWDLYFAYRDLDAKVAARDAALETWRRVHALYLAGRRGGEAEKEAQAREQYFRFQEEVENALGGRLLDGTRTDNGSAGGTFRANSGVYTAERRLRLIMGISSNDGRLLRPVDEPVMSEVVFDWHEVLAESLARRVELRKQKWEIKRRELELVANKNYLLPRVDTVGRYRWRGFGDDLIDANGSGQPRFDNAFDNLTGGEFQEWQLGVELSMPIGFRQAHAAVRNAELQVARARAILEEQEKHVLHDLSNAIADVARAYQVAQTAFNRRRAAQEQLAAVGAAFEADKASLDQLLDAQRRLADSDNRFYRAMVEYVLAIKNVHFEKGSLLDYNGIYLAEGPWPGKAYHDAARLDARRGCVKEMDYGFSHPITAPPAGPNHSAGGPVLEYLTPSAAPEPVPAELAPDVQETIPVPEANQGAGPSFPPEPNALGIGEADSEPLMPPVPADLNPGAESSQPAFTAAHEQQSTAPTADGNAVSFRAEVVIEPDSVSEVIVSDNPARKSQDEVVPKLAIDGNQPTFGTARASKGIFSKPLNLRRR